jgi:hypothetical protein
MWQHSHPDYGSYAPLSSPTTGTGPRAACHHESEDDTINMAIYYIRPQPYEVLLLYHTNIINMMTSLHFISLHRIG